MFVMVPTLGGLPCHVKFLDMSDEGGIHSIVRMLACRSNSPRLHSTPQPCLNELLALQAPSRLQRHGEEYATACAVSFRKTREFRRRE
jgi:hypothetical protein